MLRLGSLLCLLCLCSPLSAEEIKHSFFIAGPSFTGIIAEDNTEQWNSGKPAARDGYVLPNKNILIAWSDEVKEFTPDKKIIWTKGGCNYGSARR